MNAHNETSDAAAAGRTPQAASPAERRAALPLSVKEVSAEWLTAALCRSRPGVTVAQVAVVEVIFGTATKVLLRLRYAGDARSSDVDPPTAPIALCVKGALQESMRAFRTGMACRIEANFFAHIAPMLDIRLPRVHFAAADETIDQGIVIMDDLVESRCTFGSPLEPWTRDRVAAALELQARLHASTWGINPSKYAWLPTGSTSVRNAATVLLRPERRQRYFADERALVLPAEFEQPDHLLRAFRRMWALEDEGEHCLSHGDAHLGNTYVDRLGRPGFLDWQGTNINRWSSDVAYFIGGALTVNDRRAAERDLLRHYLDVLSGCGAPTIAFDDAWRAYREHSLHGLLWAVTPTAMQPVEFVRAMAERHLAAVRDLDSIQLLGD